MEEKEEFIRIKMVFVGDENTGKSQIINRLCKNEFESDYSSTIGSHFQFKMEQLKNNLIRYLIYDTSGQKKFESLIPLYSAEANILILVYDITNKNSFINLYHYLGMIKNRENVILALVGNKIDLEDKRQVTKEEAENFANENLLLFFEISAKSNEGINQFFLPIINSEVERKLIDIIKNKNE